MPSRHGNRRGRPLTPQRQDAAAKVGAVSDAARRRLRLVLLSTSARYEKVKDTPEEARALLETLLGCTVSEFQDDRRGVLMIPDIYELDARTYDGIVMELEDHGGGVWIPLDDSPGARARAAKATARMCSVEQAFEHGRGEFLAKVDALMNRGVPAQSPEAAALLGPLGDLTARITRKKRPGPAPGKSKAAKKQPKRSASTKQPKRR